MERRNIYQSGQNESVFLDPLFKILKQGESQAEIWKKKYYGDWKRNVDYIYEQNYFSK